MNWLIASILPVDSDYWLLGQYNGTIQLYGPSGAWSTVDIVSSHSIEMDSLILPNGNARAPISSTSTGRSIIKLSYRYRCRQNYYGPMCSLYCVPRDSTLGHYTCDPVTGSRVCGPGWSGTRCDEGEVFADDSLCNLDETLFIGLVLTKSRRAMIRLFCETSLSIDCYSSLHVNSFRMRVTAELHCICFLFKIADDVIYNAPSSNKKLCKC